MLVSLKLGFYLCDRFASLGRVDFTKTLMIFLVFTVCVVFGHLESSFFHFVGKFFKHRKSSSVLAPFVAVPFAPSSVLVPGNKARRT